MLSQEDCLTKDKRVDMEHSWSCISFAGTHSSASSTDTISVHRLVHESVDSYRKVYPVSDSLCIQSHVMRSQCKHRGVYPSNPRI